MDLSLLELTAQVIERGRLRRLTLPEIVGFPVGFSQGFDVNEAPFWADGGHLHFSYTGIPVCNIFLMSADL